MYERLREREQGLIALFVVAMLIPASAIEWVNESPEITILSGTNATFQWEHSITDYVDITWYYIGTNEKPDRVTLMLYTRNFCIPYGLYRKRLSCVEKPGSATMMLSDVTSQDVGNYEVKVVTYDDVTRSTEHISSVTSLKVVNAADYTYKLSVNGSEYHGVGVPASPEVVLPHRWPVHPPGWLNITSQISPMVAPPVVRMWKVVGESEIPEPVCLHDYCNRYIRFCSDDLAVAKVIIELDFQVQNFPKIRHVVTVDMEKNANVKIAPNELLKLHSILVPQTRRGTTPNTPSVLSANHVSPTPSREMLDVNEGETHIDGGSSEIIDVSGGLEDGSSKQHSDTLIDKGAPNLEKEGSESQGY